MTPPADLASRALAARTALLALCDTLAALTPTPTPVAPPAGKYEPRVGDFVTWGSCTAMWRVLRVDSGGVYAVLAEKRNYTTEPRYLDPSERETLRLATPSELAAAGLAVPPPAPTPAPEAKRPTHVRVTKVVDTTFDVTEGSVYEVVHWYDDGGGAVSPQVMADNGELVELAYVDHSDADYCPSWEPAPCPPPVAGSESKDEALRRAAERILDSASRLSRSARPLGVGGCGHSVDSGVLGEVESDIDDLRSALSRPVRP